MPSASCLDLEFSCKLSKILISHKIYCLIRLKFSMFVFFFTQKALNAFERFWDFSFFWEFYDIFGLWKKTIFPQNFHNDCKVIVRFSLNFACKFVFLVITWCCKMFLRIFGFWNLYCSDAPHGRDHINMYRLLWPQVRTMSSYTTQDLQTICQPHNSARNTINH